MFKCTGSDVYMTYTGNILHEVKQSLEIWMNVTLTATLLFISWSSPSDYPMIGWNKIPLLTQTLVQFLM